MTSFKPTYSCSVSQRSGASKFLLTAISYDENSACIMSSKVPSESSKASCKQNIVTNSKGQLTAHWPYTVQTDTTAVAFAWTMFCLKLQRTNTESNYSYSKFKTKKLSCVIKINEPSQSITIRQVVAMFQCDPQIHLT